jgi:hypothetical protein
MCRPSVGDKEIAGIAGRCWLAESTKTARPSLASFSRSCRAWPLDFTRRSLFLENPAFQN